MPSSSTMYQLNILLLIQQCINTILKAYLEILKGSFSILLDLAPVKQMQHSLMGNSLIYFNGKITESK